MCALVGAASALRRSHQEPMSLPARPGQRMTRSERTEKLQGDTGETGTQEGHGSSCDCDLTQSVGWSPRNSEVSIQAVAAPKASRSVPTQVLLTAFSQRSLVRAYSVCAGVP